jgi:replicative DNA helicase
MIEHPLPFSSEIEKSVLSAFLQWPHLMDEHHVIGADHFHLGSHRLVFERAKAEWTTTHSSAALDLTTFGLRMHQDGTAEKVGGISAISEIYGYVPTHGRLKAHLEILTTYRARRMAIEAARALESAALDLVDERFIDAAGEPMTAVHEAAANAAPPRSTKEVILAALTRFEQRLKGEISPMGIATIPEIDGALRGLKGGRVWVIGAYPSGGKSLIAGQMVTDAALDGNPGIFITLEMSEDDLMDRCLIQTSRVASQSFMDPKAFARENGNDGPTKGHLQAVSNATQALAKAPLHLVRPKNKSLAAILAVIRRAHREHGIKVAAVDYLQLIRGKRGQGDSKEQEVADISHAFQSIAQELDIHVLILTQLNAEGETKHGRVIEEDADAFLVIVQDRNRDSETFKQHQHILVAKDRHHGMGGTRLPLILNHETLRFGYGIPEKPEKPVKSGGRFAR